MRVSARALKIALGAAALLLPAAAGAQAYTILHTFGSGTDGSIPYGPLTVGEEGRLYGVTSAGGGLGCEDYGCGTVFMLAPGEGGEWKETILHRFADDGDGASPGGNVVGAGNNLFGTLSGAGPAQQALFELSAASGELSLDLIYDVAVSPGLALDKAGNIYGPLGQGNLGAGAIGELSPGTDGWTYTQLYSFCSPQGGCPDGEDPEYPLTWDELGNLYGTTLLGGNSTYPYCPGSAGCGVAFQMTPNPDGTWAYYVMHRFADSQYDGQYPDGGLAIDAAGNAYGVAGGGGPNGTGTVFELKPSSSQTGKRWNQVVLYDFPNCNEGCSPGRTMVFDKAGNLYGVAAGGTKGYGVVFKLSPHAGGEWSYTVVHNFVGSDGEFPWGVTLDDKGNLFGTTENGGTYNAGVAFEISP